MKCITVNASRKYDVCIDRDLLNKVGQYASDLNLKGKAAIISDSNVWPIYGETVQQSLMRAGFEVCSFIFTAGESSKCGSTYLEILNYLAENRLTRTDFLVALGGGVVGDITGFAAATYLRGISCIQIPTTLLSMVDSSVGGKTAIDLPAGKNLAGAFYQPNLVLCDIDTLKTLPAEVFRDGCAEVIKYGILYDAELFTHLEDFGLSFDREAVVARCVELKRNVVAEDEFDRGSRQKLNLGHTIGHGIEACSEYKISHGEAVGTGIAIISRSACQLKLCSCDTCRQILSVLEKFQLPLHTDYTSAQLYCCALSDKKRAGNTVNLIVPRAIGDCFVLPTDTENLESIIKAGL